MPKIRGVKPDYWTDEDIVELTRDARLLYIGLWNYACDNGHLPDKPRQIKLKLLPGDDDSDVPGWLTELATNGRITRADGWITVPKLARHQRVDRRYFTTCDKPGCTEPAETSSQREARRVHGEHTSGARRAPSGRSSGARVDGDGDSAAAAAGVTDLPPAVEILRAALEAKKLWVRWDRLGDSELGEIEQLVERHGDGPLVKAALQAYQPDRPPVFAQAWLGGWRELREVGRPGLVAAPCGKHGHSGTVKHCIECAGERNGRQDEPDRPRRPHRLAAQ